jgi:hypothetical protein
MFTANDIVYIGDKIEVFGGSVYCKPRIHILAQVQQNLFTLIEIEGGNRICNPFPCKYGTRLHSEVQYSDSIDTQLYGSFTLFDLKNAICSQSTEENFIGKQDCDKWQYKIIKRFCHESVFERLAEAWNKKECTK